MSNTDSKNLVSALVCDAIKHGITDPNEIVKHIAGVYTKDGKEIVKNESCNQNGRRNGGSPN